MVITRLFYTFCSCSIFSLERFPQFCSSVTDTVTLTNETAHVTSHDEHCLWLGIFQNPFHGSDTLLQANINYFAGVDGTDNYIAIGEGKNPENYTSVIFNHSNIHYGVDFFLQKLFVRSEYIWIQYRSYRIKVVFNISLSIVNEKGIFHGIDFESVLFIQRVHLQIILLHNLCST